MKVQHFRSNVAGKEPQPSELVEGELAINFKDHKIFTKDPDGVVLEMGVEQIFYYSQPNYDNSYIFDFSPYKVDAGKSFGITYDSGTKEFTVTKRGYYLIEWFGAINTSLSGKKLKIVQGSGMQLYDTNGLFLYRLDDWGQLSNWDMDIPNTNSNWMKHNFMFPMLPLNDNAKFKIEAENAGGKGFDGKEYEWFSIRRLDVPV